MAIVFTNVDESVLDVLRQVAKEKDTTLESLIGQCTKVGILYALSDLRDTRFRATDAHGNQHMFGLFDREGKELKVRNIPHKTKHEDNDE